MMKIPPGIERLLLGAVVGAGLASGKVKGAGVQFLGEFLRPVAKSARAIEFVAQAMVNREVRDDDGRMLRSDRAWKNLSDQERELWRDRAEAAMQAMMHLVSQSLAGGGRSSKR